MSSSRWYGALAALLLCSANLPAQTTAPTLRTRWAADVSPTHPWPEYPRPQMVRREWQNLNGQWEYAVRDSGAAQPAMFDGRILVPFAIESQLSGVQKAVSETQALWYRRSFRAPARSRGDRVLLHFGAADWQTDVYVNGKHVGAHRGGYDPFTFDITDALKAGGAEQSLVVRVWDPTDAGNQPRGKQVRKPRSIWYTAVTGIWQTVWLERVPSTYIASLEITPNLDDATVRVRPTIVGRYKDTGARVTILDGRRAIASGDSTDSFGYIVVHVPGAKPWSPAKPFLYHVRVTLRSGDAVESYVGMRKISLMRDSAGYLRLALNNKPMFELGLLDQGWWPDGLYTAPTNAALRSDIETMKRLGFNLARKHVKVEPERWYYDCDSLGFLVWQDMPSAENKTAEDRAEFASELSRMIDALRNHPSIVMWVPFNEGWGQYDTRRVVDAVRKQDPSRLVNNASGWTDMGAGDVSDIHSYPGPAMPAPDSTRALVLGEFGGLGLPLAGHTWLDSRNWGYRTYTTLTQLGDAYRALMTRLQPLIAAGLAASIYTQTTDVEIEVNGIMTYDRAVVKLPSDAPTLHAMLTSSMPSARIVMPTSAEAPQTWRYTTTPPPAEWMSPAFGDSAWSSGAGGFGSSRVEQGRVHTPWTSSDLWIRRTVDLPTVPEHPYLIVHHDEDAEIYINGVRADSLSGYTNGYIYVPLSDAGARALKAGKNTIAAHVRNTRGEQYIDIGIADVTPRSR